MDAITELAVRIMEKYPDKAPSLKQAKTILACFAYEDGRGNPVPVTTTADDIEKQVGMTPDEFKRKYADILEDDVPEDRKTAEQILIFINKTAAKYNIATDKVLSAIEAGNRNMSDILSEKGGNE